MTAIVLTVLLGVAGAAILIVKNRTEDNAAGPTKKSTTDPDKPVVKEVASTPRKGWWQSLKDVGSNGVGIAFFVVLALVAVLLASAVPGCIMGSLDEYQTYKNNRATEQAARFSPVMTIELPLDGSWSEPLTEEWPSRYIYCVVTPLTEPYVVKIPKGKGQKEIVEVVMPGDHFKPSWNRDQRGWQFKRLPGSTGPMQVKVQWKK